MWRHVLLCMPVLGLGLFFVLPFTSALAIYLVIVFVSYWLYYKIMESIQAPASTGAEALTNRIVDTDAQGAIHWQGEWWTTAPKGHPRLPNRRVRIVALRGLRLIVRPYSETKPPQSADA